MSAETERAQAVGAGASVFHKAFAGSLLRETPDRIRSGIRALLDDGWIPPARRNEELRQTAEWQCDARRAFEAIESIANDMDNLPQGRGIHIARRLRDALGERFLTPPEAKS